jgi:hypothetical protein
MNTIPFSEKKNAIMPNKLEIAAPLIINNNIEVINPIILVPTPKAIIILPTLIL